MKNCLIVDDEKTTLETIRDVGNDFSEISFRKASANQEEALELILKMTPDLIILNIDSSKINLAEFLYEIREYRIDNPVFIAMSSFADKALIGYKYNFSDFLLKPTTKIAVRKCLLRYQKKFPVKCPTTICLKSYKDYQYLNMNKILFLKADNNTTDFYMDDGRVIGAYKTLKVFEDLLPKTFLRIHKSYIINRNCVSRIHYGKSICVIGYEKKIPFTKTFIENVDLINTALSKNTMITLN